jgi:hypothetical protein
MAKGSFPRPYVNKTEPDNSIMEYVPFPHGDIGCRKSNTPNGIKDSAMGIQHVENRKGS